MIYKYPFSLLQVNNKPMTIKQQKAALIKIRTTFLYLLNPCSYSSACEAS